MYHFLNSKFAKINQSAAPRQFLLILRQLGRPEPARLEKSGKSESRAGPAELRPSGYSWFGFRNPRDFSVPFSRLMENHGNLLIFLIFHQFALASQPIPLNFGTTFLTKWVKTYQKCINPCFCQRRKGTIGNETTEYSLSRPGADDADETKTSTRSPTSCAEQRAGVPVWRQILALFAKS